jgi:hypothetical protein
MRLRLAIAFIAYALLLGAFAHPASAAITGKRIGARMDNAVYDWWAQSVSVNDGDFTWIGTIARGGTVRVAKTNPATGTYQWATLAPAGEIAIDEHNTPALAYDDAKPYLIAFYTQHGTDNIMRYRTVDRDSLAVGPLKTLTFSAYITYAQVIHHGDRLMILTRVTASEWRYRLSDDFGDTWGDERILINGSGLGQMYSLIKPASDDGDLNHLVFYGHPISSTFRNVVYAQIHLQSGEVTRMDGTVIGNINDPDGPSLLPDQMQAAITPGTGWKVRLLDVGMVAGKPAITYAVWNAAVDEAGPATYKVKMYHDNNTWTTPSWVAAAGGVIGYDPAIHYVGGTALGPNGLLYSVRNSGTTWIFEKWQWNGTTFVFVNEIARDSTQKLARPYVPLNAGATQVTVVRFSKYVTYTNYDSDVLVYP